MRNTFCKAFSLATLLACLWLLLPGAAAFAQEGDDDASERNAWWTKVNSQNKGMRAEWSGTVAGDINKSIQGTARLHFVEVDGGRLNISFFMGETHTFYNGVMVNGIVSCARGSRSYPVWKQRRAYEQRPAGQLTVRYTDPDAIASRRVGASASRGDDYRPGQGRVTLTLEEDRLDVHIRAQLDTGLIRFDTPPYETESRILLTARTSVERTLENEDLFDTSRCEAKPPFEVVSVKPEDGRANVLLEEPEILVELSQDVHRESLENPDLVVVRTLRQPPGEQPAMTEYGPLPGQTVDQPWTTAPDVLADDDRMEERVSGTLDLKEPNILRFVPDAPLRSGVRYQIDLAHGNDGIRSDQFHVLEEVPPTWFTTWIDPQEVRMHVYQTTRDAALLQRKPAVARVYVDWDRHTDIDPDWQVEEVEIDLELTRNQSQRAVLPVETHWVRRPDLYDDEDRRMARDSVNRFGWSPRGTDVRQLVARVKPHDHWPTDREAPEETGDRDLEYASRQVDDLTVEAYMVRMADWRFELPPSETTASVIQAFQLDNEYARQVFPVVNVRGRFAGFFEPYFVKPSTDGTYLGSLAPVFDDWDALRDNYRSLVVQAKLLHDQIGRHSTADIVVGYYPPAFTDGQGKGILGNPTQQANVVLMPVKGVGDADRPAILDLPLVAHEYGHIFGLPHVPYVADGKERLAACRRASYYQPSDGIEGFRIAAGGRHGWSKSSTTGNAQNAETLKDLMFPCQYDGRWMWWINDVHYKMLVETLPGILQSQRAWRLAGLATGRDADVGHAVQMQRPVPAKREGIRHLLVSGFTDGADTLFLPAVDVPTPDQGSEPDSNYTLVVEAADGTRLASRRVERISEPGAKGPGYFSSALEVAGEPARVLLMRDDAQVGELVGTGAPPPAPELLSHEDGATLEAGDVLRWQPAPEGAPTVYSVRYRAGVEGPTQVLATLTPDTVLPLDPTMLPPGEDPSLEVVAHSGLHESSTRIRVQVPKGLRPILVLPAGEVPAGDEQGIGAWFNTDLDPDSVGEDMIRLLDADGSPVPLRVIAAANGNGVQALPEVALEPGVRYTVHLAPGLEATDGRVMRSAVRWSFRAPVPDPEQAGDAAREQEPTVRLPRSVDPLGSPWNRAGAEGPDAAANGATGEATVVETQAQAVPVEFRVCREAADTSARVLLDGSFGSGDGGGRFRLERVAGDALAFTVELEPRGDRGPVTGQRQGSLERPGQSGLTLSESAGHWTIAMMLDHQGGRIPVFLRANCGLD